MLLRTVRRLAPNPTPPVTIHDLLSKRSHSVVKAPYALRRDTLPESFVEEYLPDGWTHRAEEWCERVLGPHLKSSSVKNVGGASASTAFAERYSGARHPLFQKCLIAPSYFPSDVDPRVRAMVVPPQALLVAGLNVLKLTANTLSLYSGRVPSDASLVSLLPMDRMADVAQRWRLFEVLLHDYDTQIEPQSLAEEEGNLPLKLVPSVVVQLTGAVSLLYGPAIAGDLAIAEVFPKVRRQTPSSLPLVFL